MSDLVARRSYVSGRVQGVFFRAATRQRAAELGVTGYAMNLADGRVEVLACGDPGAVAQLGAWLWQGPPSAQVTQVETVDVALEHVPQGFRTA
jgi:acylphosphatase